MLPWMDECPRMAMIPPPGRPTLPSSSCRMPAARVSMTRANSNLVVSRSPVAIGIEVPRATCAITSGMSGGTGSSNHRGS